MARLVILSEGQMGRTFDLKDGTTTVGRVEDNAFQIAEPSVSSHHGEFVVSGASVIIRDLNSTNGTFVNGQQVTTEAPLKPGQILRLGQIELRLEAGSPSPAPAPAAASAPAAAGSRPSPAAASRPAAPAAPSSAPKAPAKKLPDQTMVIPQGVKLGQDHGTKPPFENGAFSKKSDTGTKIFIGAAVLVGLAVVGVIVYHLLS